MKYVSYLFWLLVVVVCVFFAAINSETVSVNYYFSTVAVYFPLLLIIILFVGFILGVVATLPMVIRLKSRNRHQRHKMKTLEKEIANLRTVPISDQ